jgi:formamidopyrimidine-DNA glycosylase
MTHEQRVGGERASDVIGKRLHGPRDAVSAGPPRQAGEGERHALEAEAERDDAAAVDGRGDSPLTDVGGLGDLPQARLLDGMTGEPVAVAWPAGGAAERQHAGVLPRAVVLDRGRVGAAFQFVLGCRRALEERANGGELVGACEMRRAGDRDFFVRQIGPSADDRQRLQRLGRGAHEGYESRVAGFEDDGAVLYGDRVHDVAGLDETAADRLDANGLHSGSVGGSRRRGRTQRRGQSPSHPPRRRVQGTVPRAASPAVYADAVPELPEIEAWVRELDAPVSAGPVERAGPAHVATLKTFDPPLRELEGRRFAGARRRGKNLLFPTGDGELVLRVHLMSAGRLRYLAAGAKGPKTPAFRLRFEGGGELILTEAGKKKRAGVWLLRPAALEEELAHLGPDALEVDAEALAEILGRESRRLHPLLRDQRALAGIGRAHANEILLRAHLSPFALSAQLDSDEIERLATAIREDLERALELRERGKGDRDIYRVHRRLGEPCPQCGTPIERVDYEEHTVFYCPTCQTGGRVLKDRRLSRLLR